MKTQNRPGLRVIVDGIEYEPKPKPLLADAKVGDLCKRMDGKWVQIETLCSLGGMPWICYEIGGLRYINNGEQLNTKDRNLDIIDYHPLAPEGTAEWALQMWKLGKDIRNETGVVLMGDYESEEIRVKHLVDIFPSGWQLYEPEPESPKEPDYVTCKRCGGSQSAPNPAVSNTAYTTCPKCGGTGYEIKPEPAKEQFEVGDWVEYRGSFGIHIGRIDDVSPNGNKVHIRVSDAYGLGVDVSTLRKLAPSQVVITIGCMSGTVSSQNDVCFTLKSKRGVAVIQFAMLDTRTRELVESLLKAQEEE